MKRVLCIWEDASDADDGTWIAREGIAEAKPVIFHQVGYLFKLTANEVLLTACVGDDHIAPRSRIPTGMVKALVELQEGNPVRIPKRRKAKA
jgi:hypothetical protein